MATTLKSTEGGFPGGSSAEILSLIRHGSARTRAELIRRTGLSRSTMAQRLSELFEANLIAETGGDTSTGGRPPTLLTFNGSAGVVIGTSIGATGGRVAVVELGGRVLAEDFDVHTIADGPTAILEQIARRAQRLLDQAQIDRGQLWGFGVGLPGPVEFATGRPISPPLMPGWDGFPVVGWLEERFSCAVRVDNDANVMALGEREHHFAGEDQFIFVKFATGISAGVIIDGSLYRGAHGSAGDIGHIYVPGHDEVTCECGNSGCLEAVVGGGALARKLAGAGLETQTSRDVLAAVLAGNTSAIQAVRDAGRELGLVLAGLVNALNPAVIVIGGTFAAAGDHLLAGVREATYRRSPPLATRNLRIVASAAGPRAGLIGAAAMISRDVLEARLSE